MSKIIVVTGATGAQGGGLVDAVLAHPEAGFTPRAVTRDPTSPAARALAARGVDVVRGDLDDRASLTEAFAGAHGAFCVTNFWEHGSPEREGAQARNLAAAARTAGVAHAIWSTLEDVREYVPLSDPRIPTLPGGYKVPHCDAKGAADRDFRASGVPTTFLRTSFYWENFISLGMGPQPGADGVLEITLPIGEAPLPGISAPDIGSCALGLFAGGPLWHGRTVGIAGGHPTGAQMAGGLSRALGRPVRFAPMSLDAYRALGFPGVLDIANMFQFKREFTDDYCAVRDVAATRALHPGLLSFDAWATRHASETLPRPSAELAGAGIR